MKVNYKIFLILFVSLFFVSEEIFSEGTKEVMPTSSNGTALMIKPEYGYGSYRGSPSTNRIYFNIKNNSTENFYFGLKKYQRLPSAGVPYNVYYRIVNPSGTQVVAPTLVPSSGTGYISTYAQAVAGPNINNNTPSGYTPITYNPTVNGEFYIEIYKSYDGGTTAATDQNSEVFFPYFDFTVATSSNVQYTGRVHSQAWSFIVYDPNSSNYTPSLNYSFEGAYYGYTADSAVNKVTFGSGFNPLGFTLQMNYEGVGNTNNFAVDRQSVDNGLVFPTIVNPYPVFLNTPDITIYPVATAANQPVITGNIYGCPGGFFIPYYINKPGDVAILLDINGVSGYQSGTSDIVLEDLNMSSGNHVMSWDGLDGQGNAVSSGVTISITADIYRGRTNIPIYDAEYNKNGLSVTSIYPNTGSRELYWDDTQVGGSNPTCGNGSSQNEENSTGVGVSRTNFYDGVVGPAHSWDGPNPPSSGAASANGGGSSTSTTCDDFGNARTINTWFWADNQTSTPVNKTIPSCSSAPVDLDDDDDGISDLVECGGVDPDADADNDNIPNYIDPSYPGFVDVNHDGVNDNFDHDLDGIINSQDLDSDNDGILDILEAGGSDANHDGTVDNQVDVNLNGIDDNYDIACDGSTINDYAKTIASTSGALNNPSNAADSDPNSYCVIKDGAYITLDLGLIISSGTTITVNLATNNNNGGTSTGTITQSADNSTFTNSQVWSYTTHPTNGIATSYTLSGDARYIRVSRAAYSDKNGRLYMINYSITTCNGTMGTAIANPNTDGDGLSNFLDLDSDNDGIPDVVEAGGVDTDGDGWIDGSSDSDGDGIRNAYDSNNGGVDIANLDTDGDGVKNYLDLDSDNDGIPDVVEALGTDANNDGIIDSYSDSDNDGFSDNVDGDAGNDGTTENTANALIITGSDGNSDGEPDSYTRANNDGNGMPNPYDLDADGDGILDTREGGISDSDNNGIADGTLGADGWSNTVDALGSLNLTNTDGDGNPDYIDIDADNDGIVDLVEGQSTATYTAPSGSDSDGDGIDNNYDNNDGSFGGNSSNGVTPENTDLIDNPDYRDLETDDDGTPDRIEGWDTNGDGQITGSEIAYVGTTDSDNDGLLDEYDSNDNLIDPTNGNTTPNSHPDAIDPGNDRDWREQPGEGGGLPVSMINAKVELIDGSALISWETLTEINNDFFWIEKSQDGKSFEFVGQVKGAGNSNTLLKYKLVDASPYKNISYYRISQFDFDGSSEAFPLLTLDNRMVGLNNTKIYPNPATQLINILSDEDIQLQVYSSNGLKLMEYDFKADELNSINTSSLSSGVYYFRIIGLNRVETQKVIIE